MNTNRDKKWNTLKWLVAGLLILQLLFLIAFSSAICLSLKINEIMPYGILPIISLNLLILIIFLLKIKPSAQPLKTLSEKTAPSPSQKEPDNQNTAMQKEFQEFQLMFFQFKKFYKNLINSSPMGIMLFTLDTEKEKLILNEVNHTAAEILNRNQSEMEGKSLKENFSDLQHINFFEKCRQIASFGNYLHDTAVLFTDEQAERSFEFYVFQIEPGKIAIFLHLIDEKRRSKIALKESEENLRITLASIGEGFIATDENGYITRMNSIAEKLCGWRFPEAKGQPLRRIFLVEDTLNTAPVELNLSPNQKTAKSSSSHHYFRLLKKNGGECFISYTLSPIKNHNNQIVGYVLVFQDTSSQIEMEQRLRQSNKLKAIGHLAGGVAHDFNNMLGGILGAAEVLSLKIQDNPEQQAMLDLIRNVVGKAAKLVNKLLTFSRAGQRHMQITEIQSCIQNAVDLLSHSIDKRIQVRTEFPAEKNYIYGDVVLLENIFLNLGVNARDAMPEGGILTYRVQETYLDKDFCQKSAFDLKEGSYIKVCISDTGKGISQSIRERIFEPFFTTKQTGEGTGLGLSEVYGAVQDHKGAVELQSEIGKGSCFSLYFPKSQSQAKELEKAVQKHSGDFPECILLIEDDVNLSEMVKKMLEQKDVRVLQAMDGEEGIEVFKNHQNQIDLILLDTIMPNMDGPQCFKVLKKMEPEIKVILLSGYTRVKNIDSLMDLGLKAFLHKPFSFSELIDCIYEVYQREDGKN